MAKPSAKITSSNLLKIGAAAKALGVSIDTLRRWEKAGKIQVKRTTGGTRLYHIEHLKKVNPRSVETYQTSSLSTEELLKRADLASQGEALQASSVIPVNAGIYLSERKVSSAYTDPDFHQDDNDEIASSPAKLDPRNNKFGLFKKPLVTKFILGSAGFLGVALVLTTLIAASHLLKPKDTQPPPLVSQQPNTDSAVLAVTSASRFLEINSDTQINGSLSVRDQINNVTLEGTPSANTVTLASGNTTLTITKTAKIDQDVSTAASPTLNTLNLTGTKNQIVFQSGGPTGTLTWTPTGTAKIITLPDATTTLVGKETTDTLKNKSISGSDNTLTNIPNSALTNHKVTVTAGTNLTGGGDVELGSSITIAAKDSPSFSGQVLLADGTAAAPSLSFTNETSTGLYRIGSKKIGLITGGSATSGITIDSSGNVGIGTISPSTALYVTGAATVTGATTLTGAATLSSTLAVTGTTTLSSTLGVTGATTLSSTLGVTGATTLSSTLNVSGNSTFGTNTFFVNTTTGNVGIGTTSPRAPLELWGNNATSALLLNGNVGINTTAPSQQLQINSGTSSVLVTSAGNVGIGATSTAYNLDVWGTGRISSALTVGGNLGIGTSLTVSSGSYLQSSLKVDGNTQLTTLTTTGNVRIGGSLTVAGITANNGDVSLGSTTANNITFNGVVNSNIIPDITNSHDLGSASKMWANGYFTNVTATNIAGTVTGGSTTSATWLINSGNSTNNAQISALAYSVGTAPINAVIQWNAANDSGSKIAGFDNTLLTNYPVGVFSQVSGGNQSFTSGSIFKYSQPSTHAITQSGAFIGSELDFSSNMTVPNSSSGNQTGVKVTLKDGGAAATSIGYQTAGILDYGLYLQGETQDYFSGNVGIGVSFPIAKLSVQGNVGIGYSNSVIPSNGLAVSGNVGIGTTSPVAPFQVQGNGTYSGLFLNGNNGIGTLTPYAREQIQGAGTGTGLTFLTTSSTGTQNFTVLDNGNVGIGTTGPVGLFQVGSSASAPTIFANTAGNVGIGTSVPNKEFVIKMTDGIGTNGFVIQNSSGTDVFHVASNGIINSTGDGTSFTALDTSFGKNIIIPSARSYCIVDCSTRGIADSGGLRIFDPSTIHFDIGASQKVTVDSSGNLGIGIAAPYAKLQSVGSGTGTGVNFLTTSSAGAFGLSVLDNGNVGIGNTGPVQTFQVNTGSSSTVITSSGNVGVGTTSPTAPFHVWGNSTNSAFFLNGNVGVGTTTPSGQLDVSNSFYTSSGNITLRSQDTTSSGGRISFLSPNSSSYSDGSLDYYQGTFRLNGGTTSGSTHILRWSGATTNPSLDIVGSGPALAGNITGFKTIDSASNTLTLQTSGSNAGINLVPNGTGNVGIGVTTPISFLGVGGNTAIGSLYGWQAAPTNGLAVQGNVGIGTTTANSTLSVAGSAHIGSVRQGISAPTDGLFVDGNVGIGATTSSNKLDVWGNTRITGTLTVDGSLTQNGSITTGSVFLASNGSTSAPSYSFTNSTSTGMYSPSTNALALQTNGASTPPLTITATGNVGIGVTNAVGALQVNGAAAIGYGSIPTSSLPSSGLAVSGNLGIGTTSPLGALHVVGQCVTGDTKLRRRKKKKGKKGEADEWEEVPIKDTKPGDEILSMDLDGTFTWSKVNNLMDMGLQDTYKLITKTGKQIRTTGNHPYFVLEKRPAKELKKLYTTFEIDQSNRLEDMGIDSVVALASKEMGQVITVKISKKAKLGIFKKYYQNKRKLFGPEMMSILIIYAIWTLGLKASRLIIDKEYPNYEEYISNFITASFPEIVVSFRSIGHQVMAHRAAWSRATKRRTPQRSVLLKTLANLDFEESLATELLHSGLVTEDSQSTRSSVLTVYQSPISLSMSMSEAKWVPAQAIRKGMLVATIDGWEVITAIYKTGAREQTYDIEVENTHNFVGNDIVAHNTYINGNLGIGAYSGLTVPTNGLAVSGNVGIGITTANSTLSVSGNAHIGGIRQGVSAPTNGLFVDGNVGIGATTSSNLLDVWGNSRIAGNLTTDSNLTVGGNLTVSGTQTFTGNTTYSGQILGANGSASLPEYSFTNLTNAGLWTNGNGLLLTAGGSNTSGITVTGAGNVGIGKTNPSTVLDVTGAGTFSSNVAVNGGSLTTTSTTGNLFNTTATTVNIGGAATTINLGSGGSSSAVTIGTPTGGAANTGASLTFGPGIAGTGGQGVPLTIQAGLGDGNSSPGGNLSLLTQASQNGQSNSGGITLASGTAGSSQNSGSVTIRTGSVSGGTAGSIIFQTNGTNERARIDSNGNLGIGFSSPNFLFQVNSGANTTFINSSGNLGIGATTSNNKLDVWGNARIAGNLTTDGTLSVNGSSTLSSLTLTGANAALSFTGTTPSLTSGANSFSLFSGGNVGIGTSANLYGALTIQGKGTGTGITLQTYGSNLTQGLTVLDNGNVGIGTTNPSAALQIGSGQIFVPNGTQTVPSYSFANSTSSGLWSPATGIVALTANGAPSGLGATINGLSVNSSGQIGVGTTNPTVAIGQVGLSITGQSSELNLSANAVSGRSYSFVSTTGSAGLYIRDNTAAAYRAFLDANGNLGINTISPGSLLGVNGSAAIGTFSTAAAPTNGLAVSGNIGIGITTANSTLSVAGNAHIGGLAQGISAPTNGLFVDGNVGIGATTSSNKLDVWGNTRITGTLTVDGSIGNLTSTGIFLAPNGSASAPSYSFTNNNTTGLWLPATNIVALTANGTGSLQSGNTINGLSINSTGNVGIGTTGPNYKLQVSGGYIALDDNQYIVGNGLLILTSSGGNTYLGNTGDTFIRTTGVTAMTLKATSGNVGINTAAPSQIFQVNANASNPFVVTSGGNVGIGFTSPAQNLTVYDSGAKLETFLVRATNGANGWNTANATLFIGKDATTSRSINAAGTINQSGADYAEYFYQQTPGELQKAEAACLSAEGKAKKCSSLDNKILGVVSTNPGTVGNDVYDQNNPDTTAVVGLLGQIPTKVLTENGPIHVGDYISLSSVPGVGAKAIKQGFVLGKALESYNNLDPTIVGKIKVLVSPIYADPNNFLASLSLDTDGNLLTPKVKVDKLLISGNVGLATTNPSTLLSYETTQIANSTPGVGFDSPGVSASVNVLASLKNLDQKVLDVASKQATASANIAGIQSDIATASASIAETKDKTNSLAAQIASAAAQLAATKSKIDSLNLTPPDTLYASGSAKLANFTVSEATVSGKLVAYGAQIQDNFKVYGNTTLGKTAVNGDLSVDGTLSIENGSELNVIGTLFIQKSSLAQKLDIFNGKIVIDSSGNITTLGKVIASEVKTNKLTVSTTPVATSSATLAATIGSATLPANQTKVTISTTEATSSAKVFITPTTPTDKVLSVNNIKNKESFDVSALTAPTSDIQFNWWIVGTQ